MSDDVLFDTIVIYQSGVLPLLPLPSIQGTGFGSQLGDVFRGPTLVYQAGVLPLRPITPFNPAPSGAGAQFNIVFRRIPVVYQATAHVLAPLSTQTNTRVTWQVVSPEVFAKPFPIVDQQFLSLGPQQFATAPVGQAGQFGIAIALPAVIYQGAASANAPLATQSNLKVNWQTLAPEVFARPVPTALQQFASYFTPPGPPVATRTLGRGGRGIIVVPGRMIAG